MNSRSTRYLYTVLYTTSMSGSDVCTDRNSVSAESASVGDTVSDPRSVSGRNSGPLVGRWTAPFCAIFADRPRSGSYRFSTNYAFYYSGQCSVDNANLDLAYHSVNRDDIEVQFGWCSYDSSSDCVMNNVGTSHTSLAQHYTGSYTSYKYKQNAPQIRWVRLNVVQDCQVEIKRYVDNVPLADEAGRD